MRAPHFHLPRTHLPHVGPPHLGMQDAGRWALVALFAVAIVLAIVLPLLDPAYAPSESYAVIGP